MRSLKEIKFVCNDEQDYIRRLERAYELSCKRNNDANVRIGELLEENK
ncbi:hypothetical protein [Heyndrickxia oleronia]|nr:hypothetical protein [Heyndrickxia oleronia]MBU5214991.1 hypothetical protein [Heyndrickxia oleronia]